jgi:hypothetical protein
MGEAFLEDGVDDDIVVVGLALALTEQLVVLYLLVRPQLSIQILSNLGSSEGLAKEDQLSVLIEVELHTGVALLDGPDFSDQFLCEEENAISLRTERESSVGTRTGRLTSFSTIFSFSTW